MTINHDIMNACWGDILSDREEIAQLIAAATAKKHSAVPSSEVAAEEPKPVEVPVYSKPAPIVEAEPLYNEDGIQLKFVPLLEAVKAAIERRKNQKTAPSVEAVPAPAPVEVESKEEEREKTAPSVEAAPAPAPKKEEFRVMSRSYDERGLHGSSFLTGAGADGKPKEVATQCALAVVVRYLRESRKEHKWLWGPLQKTRNMHQLKRTDVTRGGKRTSLWDVLAEDYNQKVRGLFLENYWDNETGEWRGYYLEESHPEA